MKATGSNDNFPKRENIQMTADFSSDTMEAKRKWHGMLSVVACTCNLRTQEDYKFGANLGYISRHCLKGKEGRKEESTQNPISSKNIFQE